MDYRNIANNIRKDILLMHNRAKASHIGSSFSCIEILVALYFKILKINPNIIYNPNRDRFIISKGHAASALYTTLAHRGFFNKTVLNTYCMDGTFLPGHSTRNCVPGVEVSTGSLGHGLPIGAGLALAGKHDKLKYRVFVLISDGECDEGTIWESALFASHYKLDNLIVIIDYNKIQALGRTNEILNLEPFEDKWKSFGWTVKKIDGHNIPGIIKTLETLPFKKGKPNVVIAHTIKGKGVSFMEDKLTWHYKSPDNEELKTAINELKIK